MKIRTFQPGDERGQATIYNEAAARLPNFKPATSAEILRRIGARDFDPSTRYYAEVGNELVGYCVFQNNGRVSYPWCRAGYEQGAELLFAQILQAMRQRKMPLAFAAYRADWPVVGQFFEQHGFAKAREMVNFIQDILDMPTAPARPGCPITPLQRSDVPEVLALAPQALRVNSAAELERNLFDNPFLSPSDLFVLRDRTGSLRAVAVIVTEPSYADPNQLDPLMPCFRLGAFGTECMTTKRIKGLFSFLARDDRNLPGLALDALSQATVRLEDSDDIGTLAAQIASDVPYLLQFYQRHFRRQGSFPVYERSLIAD